MAILNMNQLFDKLKEYIDTKIDKMEINLRELFEEYGLDEILPYLNEIKTVADNIETIQPIGNNITGLVEIINNMDEILQADENASLAYNSAQDSQLYSSQSRDYRDQAHLWAQEEYNKPVDDGVHQGLSAYHWAMVARFEAQGMTLRGTWDPNSGSYPVATENGDFWIVSDYGEFDNITWYIGDHLVWLDDGSISGFYRVPSVVDWTQIQNKPLLYTPKPHNHSNYKDISLFTDKGGSPGASGYAVELNQDGFIDNSMIKLPVVYLVGSWTPVPNVEYPDTTNVTPGAIWIITNVGPYGYTFQSGQLQGHHVEENDYMLWTATGWVIRQNDLTPTDFYKRDGSYPMTADVQVQNHKVVGVADAQNDDEAVNLGQLNLRLDDHFLKSDHKMISSGSTDQFKPIILNQYGMIDPSMVAFTSLNPIGYWNPTLTPGQEYPDKNLYNPGDYWMIDGVPSDGYTFTTGDLAGKKVYNGDYLLLGQNQWFVRTENLAPDTYLRLDGASTMTGSLNMGNQRIVNVSDATEATDAVSRQFMENELNNYAPANHKHAPDTIDGQGQGGTLDASQLWGYEGNTFYHANLNPIGAGDIQGQGHTPDDSGIDADMLDGAHGSAYIKRTEGVDWDTEVVNKPSEYPPVTATQTTIGGIRIWAEGDVLNIETTPAP